MAVLEDRQAYWKQWWHKEKAQAQELAEALDNVRRAARKLGNESEADTGDQLPHSINRTRKGMGSGLRPLEPS